MTWSGWKSTENCHVLVNQFHGNIHSKTLGCRKITSVFRDVKWCFNASWGLKGLKTTTVVLSGVKVNHSYTNLTSWFCVKEARYSSIFRQFPAKLKSPVNIFYYIIFRLIAYKPISTFNFSRHRLRDVEFQTRVIGRSNNFQPLHWIRSCTSTSHRDPGMTGGASRGSFVRVRYDPGARGLSCCTRITYTANTRHWPNVWPNVFGQRRWRWPNIHPTLGTGPPVANATLADLSLCMLIHMKSNSQSYKENYISFLAIITKKLKCLIKALRNEIWRKCDTGATCAYKASEAIPSFKWMKNTPTFRKFSNLQFISTSTFNQLKYFSCQKTVCISSTL